MFKDTIQSQVVGTLKIYDKESGDILLQKKNAIHPGNMAYVLASAMAGTATSVNSSGNAPSINWMQFGSGGSTSTTTLSYRSPRVYLGTDSYYWNPKSPTLKKLSKDTFHGNQKYNI